MSDPIAAITVEPSDVQTLAFFLTIGRKNISRIFDDTVLGWRDEEPHQEPEAWDEGTVKLFRQYHEADFMLARLHWIAENFTQDVEPPEPHAVDRLTTLLVRDEAEWERSLNYRLERLDKLRELNAPSIIVDRQLRLVHVATAGLAWARAEKLYQEGERG